MGYYIGVDVGTSYTAAAVWRNGLVQAIPLGARAAVISSAVLVREDGEVLTGEAAEDAGVVEPLRLAREFKRRLGDPTPVALDGETHSADDLLPHLVRGVMDTVRERQGGAPAGVAASHPLNWPEHKRDRLRRAFGQAGVDEVTLVSDPHAAALHHGAVDGLTAGSVATVYDLGGGTFDAAVLFATETGWEILGRPEGIDRLGGVDIDEAVFNHVADSLGGALEVLDPDDPTALAAVARLRHACVGSKESLSRRAEVSIPVTVPTMLTKVRLTRDELDRMARPSLARSVTALEQTLRSAGVGPSDLTAMLLMGGVSQMPLVADLVGSLLERPVAVAAEPKLGVALGAAIAAAGRDVADAASTSRIDPGDAAHAVAAADAPTRREPALAGAGSARGEHQHAHAAGVDGGTRRRPAMQDGAPGATGLLADTQALGPTEGVADTEPHLSTPARPFAPVRPLPTRPPADGSAGDGAGGRGGGRALWLVTGGIVVAAIVAIVAVAAFGGGDNDRVGTDTTTTSTTVVDEPGPAGQEGGFGPGSTASPDDGQRHPSGLGPSAGPTSEPLVTPTTAPTTAATGPPTSAPPTTPSTTIPPATTAPTVAPPPP
jgi:molecular chaperone DnaK